VTNEEGWHLLESHTLFRNPYLEVRQERVAVGGTSEIRDWTVVRRKKAVVVCPITESGQFVLVHQARIPVRAWLWEFPAGQVDDSMEPDLETLKATALRELTEETGYELGSAGELIDLGHYYASQGFTDEQPHLFVARPVRPNGSGAQLDSSELIAEAREFTPEQLRSMVAQNIIRDANTLSLFARLCARGLIA
jgi:ADP-ribose pyrophosphatase